MHLDIKKKKKKSHTKFQFFVYFMNLNASKEKD